MPDVPSQLDPALDFEWRVLDQADTRIVADLQHRIEKADGIPYRTSEDEVRELFSTSDGFLGMGGFVEGRLRAFGYIRIFDDEPVVASCQGGVDPKFRGLGFGSALVEWHTRTATLALQEIEAESKQIIFNVEEGHRSLETHLLDWGYQWNRSYFDVRASLEEEPSAVELDAFTTIEPWDSVDETEIEKAMNRVISAEEGRTETSKWTAQDRAGFVPEWSFVAMSHRADRPEVAGLIMASKYSQDWSVLGWREGTIDMLAVLPDFSTTDVASALISASMQAQREKGMEAVVAGLSSSSATSMMSVYDSLGFTTVSTSRVYSLVLS
ncbi:MAG: GNAT family N-acetyltransferase [Actinomycetaceae bacterium]|nr:GNAT family N-acetyltransferase [Actinomycetaceae bacterium]